MPRKIQTLLAGFGAFGRVLSNPTERLVRTLAFSQTETQDITGYVFPVSYSDAPERLRAILEVGGVGGAPFDVLLLLGVAVGANRWRAEVFARNQCGEIPDCEGRVLVSREIAPNGEGMMETTLPAEALVAALATQEIPVMASLSAGDYLCNYLLYHALLQAKMQQPDAPRVGFLHVPADPETFDNSVMSAPAFLFDFHVQAVQAALDVLPKLLSEESL